MDGRLPVLKHFRLQQWVDRIKWYRMQCQKFPPGPVWIRWATRAGQRVVYLVDAPSRPVSMQLVPNTAGGKDGVVSLWWEEGFYPHVPTPHIAATFKEEVEDKVRIPREAGRFVY